MDEMILDVPTLLVAAREVGLKISSSAGMLSIRGPTGAAGLVRLILDRKSEVLLQLGEGPSIWLEDPELAARTYERPALLDMLPSYWRKRWKDLVAEQEVAGYCYPLSEIHAYLKLGPEIDRHTQQFGPIELES